MPEPWEDSGMRIYLLPPESSTCLSQEVLRGSLAALFWGPELWVMLSPSHSHPHPGSRGSTSPAPHPGRPAGAEFTLPL